MQPTISIPKDWEYPRFTFGQRTKQGNSLRSNSKLVIQNSKLRKKKVILHFEFCILNCLSYTVLPHQKADEVRHYSDDQIQTLSVAETQQQIIAEIEEHQQQIKALQQQLLAIAGEASDG